MIQRPTKVPRAARYSLRDGWWQVGEIVDGQPVGRWQTYRPDGSPLFEARFDGKGRLQGNFKRYHPDGSLAREARYSKGQPVGKLVHYRAKGPSDDVFPSADPRVWQVAVLFEAGRESSRARLDERGVEIVDERPVTASPVVGALDPVFAGATPDGFLASGVLPRILSSFDAAAAPPPDRFLLPVPAHPRRPLDAQRFQELYGIPMPASLRAWFDAFATEPALHGMRVTRDADLVATGNVVEALICEHQDAPYRSDGLFAMVAGLIPIGTGPAGRRYCVSICEAPELPTDAVYPINLQSDNIEIPVARSLDDWAYAVALITAVAREAVSEHCARQAFERLRGRIDLREPMTAIEARVLDEDTFGDEEVTGDPAGDHAEGFHFRRANCVSGYFFHRNRWLVRLLSGNPEGAAAIYDPAQAVLDDARFTRILGAIAQPWVSFFWMFHCLAFQDPRLDQLLAAAREATSQLSRDAAALVTELAAGRTQLGAIADFQAVLEAFRALDPATKKQDEEEEDEEEEEEEEDEDRDDDEAEPALPAELVPAVAVVEWAKASGYERENLLIKYEVDVAALGLALRADPAILPYITSVFADQPWLGYRLLIPWIDGERGDLAALAPQAREWLLDRDDGAVYRWMAAARLLARVGGRGDAKLIADVLEPSLDQMFGRGLGFEAAMNAMILEEAIEILCEAIQKLGISETVIAALEGVASADSHLVDDSRGPCALALASVDRGLDAIVTGIEGQVGRDHARRISAEQLEALGRLGAASDRTAEIAALVSGLTGLDEDAKLGRTLALHDLGVKVIDVTAVLRAELERERYKNDLEDAAKHRARVLAIVARRADVAGELALPYAQSEHPVLQLAALHVLKERGVALPAIEIFDPYRVNELAAQGRDRLHAALAARTGTHLGNVALWLAEHPDESSAVPLVELGRAIARRKGPFPDEGPRYYELLWTIHALVRIGGGDKLFEELLIAEDRELADPVLRYADRLGPQVARGMVHVLLHDQHWKPKAAREWLKKRKNDPRIAAALIEHGMTLEDLARKPKDEE